MTEPRNWQPLWEKGEAAAAYQAIAEIALALQSLPAERRGGASIAGGRAGTAILYAYLARLQPEQRYQAAAAAALSAALDQMANTPLGVTLYGGFVGIGWAVEHLRDTVPEIDGETNEDIDQEILARLARSDGVRDYDLIKGYVGLGVYALERLPHPHGAACLERVIERLAQTAEERPDGITWWTPPALLTASARRDYQDGLYNVGLAHGVPGVIALLGKACVSEISTRRREQARSLLDGAVRWLLKRQQPEGCESVFPACFRPGFGDPPQASRLAWCYGDLGVSAALHVAATRVGEQQWEAEALKIARQAALRPPDQAGIVDAGICHGAAGLGHIFNRFFQATGEPLFRESARLWFERTLAMRQPGTGLAGYRAWEAPPEQAPASCPEIAWRESPGLLTGVSGIALALIAAVSSFEAKWDRLLLVDL